MDIKLKLLYYASIMLDTFKGQYAQNYFGILNRPGPRYHAVFLEKILDSIISYFGVWQLCRTELLLNYIVCVCVLCMCVCMCACVCVCVHVCVCMCVYKV